MSWTKLDDAMGEHRKTRRLLKARGLDAFGLHVLALLHSSRYLTDGLVDQEFVDDVMDVARVKDRDRAQVLDALVASGQWTPEGDGWRIHDYLDHNPTRVDVEVRRAKDAERKARGRGSQSNGSPSGVHADSAGTPLGILRSVRAESDGPVPSRPVPSKSNPESSSATPPTRGSANLGHLRRVS